MMNKKIFNLKGSVSLMLLFFLLLSIMPFSSLKVANAGLVERQNALNALADAEVRVYVGNDGTIGMESSAHPSILYRLNDAKIKNDNSLIGSTDELLNELAILMECTASLSATDYEIIQGESLVATGYQFSERIDILKEKMCEIQTLLPDCGINNLEKQQIACAICADVITNLREIRSNFPVSFPDPNLEAVIRAEIGKPTGNIYPSDLLQITVFEAPACSILDLTGMEYCINLQILQLAMNQISDITPLAGLTNLHYLVLIANQISDITPLLDCLFAGDSVDIRSNPPLWDDPPKTLFIIAQLQSSGVIVWY